MAKWPRKPCPFCGRVVTWGPKGDITLMHGCGSKEGDANYRRCGAVHADTGAACGLAPGHAENHRGAFIHGVAQWPQNDATPSEERLMQLASHLQGMLLRVEWVRSHVRGKWICAFCGGLSIEHGGDDHNPECEWMLATGVSPNSVRLGVDVLLRMEALSPAAREAGCAPPVPTVSDGENKIV